MRADKKATKDISISTIQGYHNGNWSGESYAYDGFGKNLYFSSDRTIPLDANFRRPDGKALKGFGLEIETECNGISNGVVLAEVMQKIVFAQFPEHLFKMQRDGSLHGDTSVECITQVMTKQRVRNLYSAFKSMYDVYFPAFNISAVRSGNCGMHTNISLGVFGDAPKTQEECVKKLYYIVNKHFGLCCALFNRAENRTGYCSRMACDKDFVRNRMAVRGHESDHGVSFNLGHYNAGRIEIRLVGGQKNYACFRNTMESIFFLCDAVKKLSWNDVDDVTKIFSGCNQYVFDRLKSKVKDAGYISDSQLAAIRATVIREDLI